MASDFVEKLVRKSLILVSSLSFAKLGSSTFLLGRRKLLQKVVSVETDVIANRRTFKPLHFNKQLRGSPVQLTRTDSTISAVNRLIHQIFIKQLISTINRFFTG